MRRFWLAVERFSFVLAGAASAGLLISGFLAYGASRAPNAPFLPVEHVTCGQPVELRAEDYNLLGGTRRGDDITLAWLDFCDPVAITAADGRQQVWFWLQVEVVGQVFPYAGWGYPWVDVETPFPADDREPRNPWWNPLSSVRALPNEGGYLGGDGYVCPINEMRPRGVTLFFYREAGFQLPVGTRHSGWVCLYFDSGNSLPNSFTVSLQPDRARITQWVDKLFVVRDEGLHPVPAMPSISENAFCAFARRTHPDSLTPGGPCDAGP